MASTDVPTEPMASWQALCMDAAMPPGWADSGLPRSGLPDYLCFVAVSEPNRAKNRIHWDVETDDVQRLVTHGATVIRVPDDEVPWHVLADPEGNEFCAFTTKSPAEPTG
jgi:hypothetical protein